jgi:uncharacterized SAM-binding protein YcdF (DUF218 family)
VRGRIKTVGALGVLLVLTWLSILSLQILNAGEATANERADVAVVLGAAAYGAQPSPVFEERIKHGITLYRSKKVARLLFTGGYAPGAKSAEADVGRRYAIRRGVPAQAILTETHSHTTRENMIYARRLMLANKLGNALIVSDPLHLKRALRMARDLEMDAHGAPTPTTRYRAWRSKAGFLLREVYFYNHYLITGQ